MRIDFKTKLFASKRRIYIEMKKSLLLHTSWTGTESISDTFEKKFY